MIVFNWRLMTWTMLDGTARAWWRRWSAGDAEEPAHGLSSPRAGQKTTSGTSRAGVPRDSLAFVRAFNARSRLPGRGRRWLGRGLVERGAAGSERMILSGHLVSPIGFSGSELPGFSSSQRRAVELTRLKFVAPVRPSTCRPLARHSAPRKSRRADPAPADRCRHSQLASLAATGAITLASSPLRGHEGTEADGKAPGCIWATVVPP